MNLYKFYNKPSELSNWNKNDPSNTGEYEVRNSKGELHRTDGPALEYANGHNSWFINGKLHRVDGPAVELANGTKEWYINSKKHRTDGPAIELYNGIKYWYLNGKEYSKEEFNKKMSS